MKIFYAIFVAMIFCGKGMYAAENDSKSQGLVIELQQLFEQESKSDADLFWKCIPVMRAASASPVFLTVHATMMVIMQSLLKQQPELLAEERLVKGVRYFPLLVLAQYAANYETSEPLWMASLKLVSKLDTDNDRRIRALKAGIYSLSADVVEALLGEGTDISQAPELLVDLASRCKEYRKKNGKGSFAAIQIAGLLTENGADSSRVTKTEHMQPNFTCVACKRIYRYAQQQGKAKQSARGVWRVKQSNS